MTTLPSVVAQLEAEGQLSAEQRASVETALALPPTTATAPWFMQAFVAIGAWLAALFLLAAIIACLLLSGSTGNPGFLFIILGLLFGAAAVGLRWAMPKVAFTINLALALSLLGQTLFLGGVWAESRSLWFFALIAMGLQVFLIVVYPDRLHRFLAGLALSGAALLLLLDLDMRETVHLLLWALALGSVLFWEQEARFAAANLDDFARPLGYSLPVALLAIVALSVGANFNLWPAAWWVSTLGLLAGLLSWLYFMLTQYGLHTNLRLVVGVLAGTALVLLPTLPAPGIVAAVLVLGVGFRRGNRGLVGLACVFFVVFLIAFYYNLELSLLWKSLILLSTGLACFGLRFFFLRRWRPQETPQ